MEFITLALAVAVGFVIGGIAYIRGYYSGLESEIRTKIAADSNSNTLSCTVNCRRRIPEIAADMQRLEKIGYEYWVRKLDSMLYKGEKDNLCVTCAAQELCGSCTYGKSECGLYAKKEGSNEKAKTAEADAISND